MHSTAISRQSAHNHDEQVDIAELEDSDGEFPDFEDDQVDMGASAGWLIVVIGLVISVVDCECLRYLKITLRNRILVLYFFVYLFALF